MLVDRIDFVEDNFGLGDHRTWPRADRIAWHNWATRMMEEPYPIEECDCNDLPS